MECISPSIATAVALSVVSACAAVTFAQDTGIDVPNTPRPANPPPCVAEFMRLRDVVQKTGLAAKDGHDKNVSREEICKLIETFTAAEDKWVKYTVDNAAGCGIPAEAVTQIKTNHEYTLQICRQVCSAGPAPGAVLPDIHPLSPQQNPCVWPVERPGTECKVLEMPVRSFAPQEDGIERFTMENDFEQWKLRERAVGEPLIWRESHWRIDKREYRGHTPVFTEDVLWIELDAQFPNQLNAEKVGQ